LDGGLRDARRDNAPVSENRFAERWKVFGSYYLSGQVNDHTGMVGVHDAWGGLGNTLFLRQGRGLVATILGVFVLHEKLGVGTASGFALILVGLWLATRWTEQSIVSQQHDVLGPL
jgi:hypothetical protein